MEKKEVRFDGELPVIRFPFPVTRSYLENPRHPITVRAKFHGELVSAGLRETQEVSITWPNGQPSEAAIYYGQRPAVRGGEPYAYYQIQARGPCRSSLIEGMQIGDTSDVEIRPGEGFRVLLHHGKDKGAT